MFDKRVEECTIWAVVLCMELTGKYTSALELESMFEIIFEPYIDRVTILYFIPLVYEQLSSRIPTTVKD